jgi:hypothetical protein
LSSDIVDELRESYKKYGPIRNVIRTQFGIASGNTRKQAIPDWPEVTMPVKSYYEHLQLMAADNVSEPKSPEWWTHVLSEAGKELEKEGVEPGKIVARLLEDFPLSERSIRRHLPDEFKRSGGYLVPPQGSERPTGNSIQQDDNKAITKPEPYAKGLSPSLNDNNPAQFTPAHIKLFGLIRSIKGTNFLNEKPWERTNPEDADEYTNELTKEGRNKTYQTDLTDFGLKLVVEAMGEGSSSDDPKRDAYFEKAGYQVLKFTNDEIERAPRLVRQCAELQVEVITLKRKLGGSHP